MNEFVRFRSGNNRVDNASFLMLKGAFPIHDRRSVMGDLLDHLADEMGLVCNDKQGVLLIFQIEHMKHLGGGILVNDGIQRLVPSEKDSGCADDKGVDAKNHIPGIHSFLFGEVDSDKVRAAGGGVYGEHKADGRAVDNTAENTDEQRIVGNHIRREDVCQCTCEHNGQTGKPGKFFADEFKSDINRKSVQQQVHDCVRKFHVKVAAENALDQDGQSCSTSRIESSRTDENFDVHCHYEGSNADDHNSFGIFFEVKSHNAPPIHVVVEFHNFSIRNRE